ncbi:lipase maturation factor family protein [Archangium violaceum]|uniref:lipase maturation factor family protein n=1 Tax=Archangium violaceum TaxID=83451 RepID=UPI00193B77E0|nr:lipase maturation factor family protein [Archangium violaceum]QRK10175.1 lipase maturation factor family protein [Archangium violaceum]
MRAVSPRGAKAFFQMLRYLPARWPRRRARGRVARLLEGLSARSVAPPHHRLVRQLFLRALGGLYLIAFTSLGSQVRGLYGSRGIQPMRDLLASPRLLALGRERFHLLPTLFWLDASDKTLVRGIRVGQVLSVAVMMGLAPQAALMGLWALYLSYVSAGREFLSFQWDALLLEMGGLGILTAPAGLRPGPGRYEPSAAQVALLRALVFRLYLGSGVSKLKSGDRTWRELSACDYYYETAPLPTRGGWYAHHLPRKAQRFSTLSVLALETVGPFLAFAPRPLRLAGFWLFAGLQGAIITTGNYGFFNVQSLVLGLWLLDDASLRRLLPSPPPAKPRPVWRTVGAWLPAAPLLVLGASEILTRFERPRRLAPRWLDWLEMKARPLRLVNPYGLFAVMTVRRPEIALEGSDDGETWREYTFRYKVSDPDRAPRQVAPHQPRLDWQMWFAALGSPPTWLLALLLRLLEGSPDVLKLFAHNPFPEHPPRYIRAVLYDYRMTDLETHRRTGAWWTRERLGLYLPPLSLAPRGMTSRLQWHAEE